MYEEHEPSDHYTMAQFIQQEARRIIDKLEHMTRERSSSMVWMRYGTIKSILASLEGELEQVQKLELKSEELERIIKELDEACITYNGEEPAQYFGYYIRDYANELIDACKRCMTPQESEIWEANQ